MKIIQNIIYQICSEIIWTNFAYYVKGEVKFVLPLSNLYNKKINNEEKNNKMVDISNNYFYSGIKSVEGAEVENMCRKRT